MKKITLIFLAPLLVLLGACKEPKKDEPGPKKKDKIEISDVSYENTLMDGKNKDFVVKGTYELNTMDSARISIGFNNWDDDADTHMMIDEMVIYKGSGNFSFDVTAEVKEWGTEADFSAYANIGEITNGTYVPTAGDFHTLIPKE